MAKKFMRSGRDQKIGGVCAGVAHYFDIDPTIVRVIWGVLAFCYGAGVLAYLILWVIAPVSSEYLKRIRIEQREIKRSPDGFWR